ncbi:MAG: acyltransferase family protein [Verrucomicrobia bacterium]|nr:acyltransferase family protein [Verrucomicrobiota bacterium]
MTSPTGRIQPIALRSADDARLDYLDATRAFALVLGVVFHACLSFVPVFMGWAVQDVSTSPLVTAFMAVSHSFRMELFFLLAGFFSHLTFHRKRTGDFVRSRVTRILVPFVIGWFLLRPLVISGWIMGSASLRGDVDIGAGLVGGFQTLATLPAGIFTGSHLWFLYYLALITTLFLVARGVLSRTGSWQEVLVRQADRGVAWLANSPVALVILAVPTAGTLWFMNFWGMDTPDKSLKPHFPALTIYGGFFVLGWMLSRQRELIPQFARLTALRWIGAGLGIGAILLLGEIERDPGHPHYTAAHAVYALSYALTMWSLVFLTIGVFRKLCRRPNPSVRYVADSSYWMYLVHLPLVVWLQVAVAELPGHWSLKLLFVSTVTIALSLLTYDLFVRSTFIGGLLNGRRRERVLPAWFRGLAGSRLLGKPVSSTRT